MRTTADSMPPSSGSRSRRSRRGPRPPPPPPPPPPRSLRPPRPPPPPPPPPCGADSDRGASGAAAAGAAGASGCGGVGCDSVVDSSAIFNLVVLETQAALTSGVGQGLDSAVVFSAVAVERNLGDSQCLGALGDRLADTLGGFDVAAVFQFAAHFGAAGCRDERLAGVVVNDLG